MKQILLFLSLVLFQNVLTAQVKTAGINYSLGAPAWTPSVSTGSEFAIDTVAKRIYLWNRTTATWEIQGQGIDVVSGGTAPAYTPNQTDSKFAINNVNALYYYTGGAWAQINAGASYTAGTGIAISGGNVISNTGDLSNTNELQNLSLSGQTLGITSGTGVTLPIVDVVAGTGVTVSKVSGAATVNSSGITALTGDVTASGPGSAAATIAAGAVTGAKLAAGAVSDSTKMGANVIEQSNIDNGAVWARNIARMGASSGQVLGWNGSVWGPTAAGVSGSGTTGFLPKFSSSTGLTNSAFDENTAGYITSTTRGITVGDAVSSSAAGNGFRLLRGTLSGGYFSNGSQLIFQTSSNHDIYFATNATERIRIQADGDVGVGTNNPSEKLHVVAGNFQIDAGRRHKWSDGSYMEGGGTSSLFTVRSLGNVLINGVNTSIGTDVSPTSKLDITGANGHSQFRLRTTYTPTSTADALGNPGDIAIDANYFYVKTAAGWKRAALTTF